MYCTYYSAFSVLFLRLRQSLIYQWWRMKDSRKRRRPKGWREDTTPIYKVINKTRRLSWADYWGSATIGSGHINLCAACNKRSARREPCLWSSDSAKDAARHKDVLLLLLLTPRSIIIIISVSSKQRTTFTSGRNAQPTTNALNHGTDLFKGYIMIRYTNPISELRSVTCLIQYYLPPDHNTSTIRTCWNGTRQNASTQPSIPP